VFSVTHKTLWIAAAGPVLIAGAAALLLLLHPELLHQAWMLKDQSIGWCRAYPFVLFSALVFLPAFGFPVSILLVLAGSAPHPTRPGKSQRRRTSPSSAGLIPAVYSGIARIAGS
jgi:hypothetical protein